MIFYIQNFFNVFKLLVNVYILYLKYLQFRVQTCRTIKIFQLNRKDFLFILTIF